MSGDDAVPRRLTFCAGATPAVLGVPPEVSEGGHGAIAAGVAEPARGPHRRRAGIVRIGDGELAGGQDRLAGRRRSARPPRWRSGRPDVRGTRRSGRGRDRGRTRPSRIIRAWFDWMPMPRRIDRVDGVVFGHESEHGRNRVTRLTTGAVNRVAAAPSRRQQLVDRSREVGRQLDQLEVGIAGDRVGRHDAPSARRRDHGHPRAARRGLGGERRRRLERLLDRCRPGDAGGPALAVEHLVVGRERPGVARRGRAPPAVAPPLRSTSGLRRAASASWSNSSRPSEIPSR